MSPVRPDPLQRWAHSTNSSARLRLALDDPTVTAIEADVLMGSNPREPIMSHHRRTSDLSLRTFLDECVAAARPVHIKLDFKESGAVHAGLPLVAQHLEAFARRGQCVWLNADVLPGPGNRSSDPCIDGDEFVQAVRAICFPCPALSLGWRTGFSSADTYTEEDMSSMVKLLSRHRLLEGGQLAFAVSARFLLRNVQPILPLLNAAPHAQLCVWTGTGEPALSAGKARQLSIALESVCERVGYDIRVAETLLWGLASDLATDAFLLGRDACVGVADHAYSSLLCAHGCLAAPCSGDDDARHASAYSALPSEDSLSEQRRPTASNGALPEWCAVIDVHQVPSPIKQDRSDA